VSSTRVCPRRKNVTFVVLVDDVCGEKERGQRQFLGRSVIAALSSPHSGHPIHFPRTDKLKCSIVSPRIWQRKYIDKPYECESFNTLFSPSHRTGKAKQKLHERKIQTARIKFTLSSSRTWAMSWKPFDQDLDNSALESISCTAQYCTNP
jgi:hypothetical protein